MTREHTTGESCTQTSPYVGRHRAGTWTCAGVDRLGAEESALQELMEESGEPRAEGSTCGQRAGGKGWIREGRTKV